MESLLTIDRPARSPEWAAEADRPGLESLLEAADRILDELRPVEAEEHLQQNRQAGGQ